MASLDKLRLDWIDKKLFVAGAITEIILTANPPSIKLNGQLLQGDASTIRKAIDLAKTALP